MTWIRTASVPTYMLHSHWQLDEKEMKLNQEGLERERVKQRMKTRMQLEKERLAKEMSNKLKVNREQMKVSPKSRGFSLHGLLFSRSMTIFQKYVSRHFG